MKQLTTSIRFKFLHVREGWLKGDNLSSLSICINWAYLVPVIVIFTVRVSRELMWEIASEIAETQLIEFSYRYDQALSTVKASHRVIFGHQPLDLSMEATLGYLRLFLALGVQIVNNEARMSSICLSNEKAGTRIDALVAEALGLTSIIASRPGFPEVQIQ